MRLLRITARRLGKTPGFTAIAVLTLALGIGANSAFFSVVNGVLLQALPFPESHRLVFLPRAGDTEADVSIPDGQDLRTQTIALDQIALFMPFWAFDLFGNGQPERVQGSLVEPSYFRVLGTAPVHGRVLTDADNIAGGERVAVISSRFWHRRFGGDPGVVGRAITLTERPVTVVGVMPPEFDLFRAGTDIWAPIAVEIPWAVSQRGTNNLEAIGRLAAGASLEEASAEVRTASERLAAEYPETNRAKILEAVSLRDFLVGNVRPALLVLFGAVGLVLLIACVNLANLLLVRATGREAEVAVRMAIGGGRYRIAIGTLAESALLSLTGGALGVLIAIWGTDMLVAIAPSTLPRTDEIALDGSVLGFTLGLSLLTALLFGLAPAFHALGKDPAVLLGRSGTRSSFGRRRHRFLNVFVIAEVTLAFLLLIGAGLLIRSFDRLSSVDLGFEADHVLTANLVLPEKRYGEPAEQDAAFRGIVEALERSPGVQSAAFIIGAPLAGFGEIGNSLAFDDRPAPDPSDRPGARVRPVLGDYFATMGVSILRGRPFNVQDDRNAIRVAIVNESFARRFWPDDDPVGKRVGLAYADPPRWMTVVGIAADVKQSSPAADDATTVYIPYPQREMEWARFGTLVARGSRDPVALTGALEEAVWGVDPALPIDAIATMNQLIEGTLAQSRFVSRLLGLFAVTALLIALQGIYGVLSYVVAQRHRDIGIRMALGARSSDVLGLVLGRGLLLTLIGLGIGLLAAFGLTRLISGLLFGVTPTDVTTYAVVSVLLLGTAIAACTLPAGRAARVDPAITLRYE